MENQINNNPVPMDEVNELRQQVAQFKQRIDQQEIINDRLMRHSMNARISVFTRTSVVLDAIGLLMMPLILWGLDTMGASWWFGAIVLLAVIAELTYNIICHRKLQRLFTDGNDLLTVRRGLLEFKRTERIQTFIAVPLIFFWMIALYWQTGVFDHKLSVAGTKGLITSILCIILGLLVCFGFFAWEMHRVNNSIREIDDIAKE